MKTEGMTLALVGLAVCSAAVVGLVVWGHGKAAPPGKEPTPPQPGAPPGVQPAGAFPDLKLGTLLLVDVAKADLMFLPDPTVIAIVDMLLTDRSAVSISLVSSFAGVPVGVPGGPPRFSGTIPRSAIIKILASPPPGFNPGQV